MGSIFLIVRRIARRLFATDGRIKLARERHMPDIVTQPNGRLNLAEATVSGYESPSVSSGRPTVRWTKAAD